VLGWGPHSHNVRKKFRECWPDDSNVEMGTHRYVQHGDFIRLFFKEGM
jgi:hypothetical protein